MTQPPRAFTHRTGSPRPRLRWRVALLLLYLVTGALLGRSFYLLGDRCRWVVACPYQVDYGEGGLLLDSVNIATGEELYNDYRHYPFTVATYPPVYPLLCAVGVKLFGVSFTFGRALSCLATLGVAILLWVMLRRVGSSRFAAGLAAMLFLAAPIVYGWAPLMRVDMIAVFFGIAGLYCVIRGGRWLLPAVALMVLAICTRQSSVAPLAASIVYLWWIRERRSALLVAVSSAVVVLVVFAMLQVASHGWFYRHVVVSNQNLWDARLLASWWWGVFSTWPLPFVLGLAGASYALAGRLARETTPGLTVSREPVRLLGLYFVFALAVSLTAGKIGSHLNYLLESLAASCLATGVVVDQLARHLGSRKVKAAWAALWLVLVGSLVWPFFAPVPRFLASAEPYWRGRIVEQGKEAVALIQQTRGPVLSEVLGLPLIAGRPVLLEPFEFTQMALDGNWDERVLVRDIERRRLALIILSSWNPSKLPADEQRTYGYWTPNMARAIWNNYHWLPMVGDLYVMAPADAKHPSFGDLHRFFEALERQRRR